MTKIFYWDVLKNAQELKAELRETLIRFAIDCNSYQTDVYLYIDEKSQTGELYNFQNIGGNSWLEDDHITVYTDHASTEDFYDVFNDISEVAESVGMTEAEIEVMALQRLRESSDWYDDWTVDDITMQHVIEMIDKDADLSRKCAAWREEYIRDYCCDDIDDRVDEIIAEYDAWVMDCLMQQERGY